MVSEKFLNFIPNESKEHSFSKLNSTWIVLAGEEEKNTHWYHSLFCQNGSDYL